MSCLTIFLRTTFKFLCLIALGNEILKIRLFLDMVFCIYWSKVEAKKDICFCCPIVCILLDILNGCIIQAVLLKQVLDIADPDSFRFQCFEI